MNYTEDQLIEGLLQQQAEAYRYAVKSYHAPMVKISRAIVGDAFAEEVVQDSWISVMKGLANFQRRSTLKTWILQIVSNTAKTRLKKEKNYRKLSYEENFISEDTENAGYCSEKQWHLDTPDAIVRSHELRQHIESAFDNLPAMQQAVLTLIDAEGLSTSEICRVLDLTETNVRVLIHRGRLKLRKAIDDYQSGEDKPVVNAKVKSVVTVSG